MISMMSLSRRHAWRRLVAHKWEDWQADACFVDDAGGFEDLDATLDLIDRENPDEGPAIVYFTDPALIVEV
jgi:hypothetical protein